MTKHLLLEAKAEIERLRRQNEILHAKVSTMELFATVLHTDPRYPSEAMTVDVAWELQRAADRMKSEENETFLTPRVPGSQGIHTTPHQTT